MKKFGYFLVFCVLLFPIKIRAEEVFIDEVGLFMEFGENWDVFTRDNLKDNEKLNSYNITYDYLKTFMENNDIYVDAITESSAEFFVRYRDAEINNLSNYSNKKIKKMAEEILNKTGAENYEILNINDIVFVNVSYFDVKSNMYLIEYYTVVNGKNITFTVQRTFDFEEDEISEIEEIVNRVSFSIDAKYEKENNVSSLLLDIVFAVLIGVGMGVIIYFVSKKK